MNDLVLVAALAGVACGLAGLLVPTAISRLPEPPPDPVLAELEAKALEGALSANQQRRLDEGPKPLYADVGASPTLGQATCIASALTGVLVAVAIEADRDLLMLLPLVPVGVLLAVVDLRTRLLPARVVQGAGLWAVLYAAAVWAATGDSEAPTRAAVGLAVAFVVFFLLWFIYPPGMGYGDVRLSGVLGFVLAYQGWAEFGVGLYAGFLLFGVPGVLFALVRRNRDVLRWSFPFGPFLLAGAVVGLLLGDPVMSRLVTG